MGFNYFGPKSACPVCDSSAPDCKCSVSGDGLHFCHTNRDGLLESPGFTYRGISSNGQWGLWTEDSRDDSTRTRHAPRSAPGAFVAPPKVRREESRFYAYHAHSEPLSDAARACLASSLGLPESAVDVFRECRYDGSRNIVEPPYTLPEWGYRDDDSWGVVSIHVRDQGGDKKTYGDPDVSVKRGLTWFPDWDRGGPIHVVEGASDTLALRAMGLTVLGRASNTGGVPILTRLLRDLPGRPVVVIAENDAKPDGRWPGREGAEKVAAELARALGRPVRVAALPGAVKDAREWFRKHWRPGTNPLRLDEDFRRVLRADVRVFRPEDSPPRPAAPPPDRADGAAAQLAAMAALFASLPPTPPEPEGRRAAYEDALARQQAADRRDQACHHCGSQRVLCQRHRATHQPRTIWVRCEKWGCRGCRGYLAARELRNATFRLGCADSLYEFGCADREYDAMTKRLRRAGAEYLAVRDGRGWYVVCSRRVEGSIPTTPEAALECFRRRLDEFRGDRRPVKTSHGWRLPRAIEETASHENVLSLPVGTTHEQVEGVASRFGAYSRRQMREAASRVQQVAEWVRDEPWSEEASNNFFVGLMADLGGASGSPRTPEEEGEYAIPW